MSKPRISAHAIQRYRERIGELPEDISEARAVLLEQIKTAKPKHLKLHKRTKYIPTEHCYFIASFGSIVTVLERVKRA